jgi:hypothetical protein
MQRGAAPGWVANLSLDPDLIERALPVFGPAANGNHRVAGPRAHGSLEA